MIKLKIRKIGLLKFFLVTLSCTGLLLYIKQTFAATSQILNDNFYQNPAELSLVNKLQLIAGNSFVSPKFKFTGSTYGNTGSVTSSVNNSLPYLLSAYRFSERYVFGINVTPSSYGHLNWPIDSIVANSTTKTNVSYYRIGAQSSYQFTPNLAIGIGLNLEYNRQLEINYVVPGMGNQINQISALNHSADIGLFYKINPKNSLTAAIYTPVNTFGNGTSSLGTTTIHNFSLTISEASVAFIGFQHTLNDRWFLEEKVYWSGWSIQKNLVFSNTATGSYIAPTNWEDVWSFQISTRYATTDHLALLGFVLYETNPIQPTNNQIGYPLAPAGSIAIGIDLAIQKGLSAQLLYGYGGFVPSAKINNANSTGIVSLNVQSATLQFTYKI